MIAWKELIGIELAKSEYGMLGALITGLMIGVILLLTLMLYIAFYGMARVYNWNGKRYCYLGAVPIRKEDGNFVIRAPERMVDLSRTTAYQICPSKAFCRRNRYRVLFMYADRSRGYLVVDKEMKTEIPF